MTDKELIESYLDSYAGWLQADGAMIRPAKEPPFDQEDGGVPPAMWDGMPGDGGWVKWKMLPSDLDMAVLDRLEARLPGPFPPLLRAYLSTRFHMGVERHGVRLPGVPSDDPLGELIAAIDGWAPILGAGYVPFAEEGNDTGPICFDVSSRASDGDCRVVLFDHEELLGLGEALATNRVEVTRLAKPLADSMRALFEWVFTDHDA